MSWAYSWDGENRLISASNASAVVTFGYDYMSRRYSKVVEGTSTNLFLWDGWLLVSDYSHTPTSPYSHTNFYCWGLDLSGSLQGAGGIGGLLCSVSSSGEVRHYTYDGNGNVTELIRGREPGQLVGLTASYEWDAYGNLLAHAGTEALSNPIRWSTKYWDNETGLGYWGYRYYRAGDFGRFCSKDSLTDYLLRNTYSFCRDMPVSRWEYLGLADSDEIETDPTLKRMVEEFRKIPFASREFYLFALDWAKKATASQKKLAEDLYNRMVKVCPKEGEKIILPANVLEMKNGKATWSLVQMKGWSNQQCCEKADCEKQARAFADSLLPFAKKVALAELLKHGKISAADNPKYKKETDITGLEGNGLKCSRWTQKVNEHYRATMGEFGNNGRLCFRGISVRWLPKKWYQDQHNWVHLYGAEKASKAPNILEPDVILDPWQSGGEQVVPSGWYKSRAPEETTDVTEW